MAETLSAVTSMPGISEGCATRHQTKTRLLKAAHMPPDQLRMGWSFNKTVNVSQGGKVFPNLDPVRAFPVEPPLLGEQFRDKLSSGFISSNKKLMGAM